MESRFPGVIPLSRFDAAAARYVAAPAETYPWPPSREQIESLREWGAVAEARRPRLEAYRKEVQRVLAEALQVRAT